MTSWLHLPLEYVQRFATKEAAEAMDDAEEEDQDDRMSDMDFGDEDG